MIDFRYHIVSLISVFLALAVGIVLGAGPLRDSIADELSGQVDQLRVEKESLRTELSAAQTGLQDRSTFITESAPQLLQGSLNNRTVALVQLPGADPDVTEAIAARLDQAGATVTGRITLTGTWVDPEEHTFKSGIAQNIIASMNPAPADGASTGQILAQALGQALTLRDPKDVTAKAPQSNDILELLRSSELISTNSHLKAPAYATVLVGPPAAQTKPDAAKLKELKPINELLTTFAIGMSSTGEGTVLAGTDDGDGSLLAAVRADSEAADMVTTVDGVGTITGQVTVPLALAADIAGDQGNYGLADDADAVVPPAEKLEPVDPETFARGPAKGDG